MIINFKNKGIIDSKEIYIHDSVFTGFNYNYENKKICFKAKQSIVTKKSFIFKFFNVFAFKMRNHEPWGKSPHILDWELVEEDNDYLLNEMVTEITDNNFSLSRLKNHKELVTSIFTLSSGDTLTIVSEYIVFEQFDF